MVAHEKRRSVGSSPRVRASRFATLRISCLMARVAVQFSYTYLMGVYGSFLFLRSSSIIPPIAAHIFCNWMGLPQLPSALRQFPDSRYGALSPSHRRAAIDIGAQPFGRPTSPASRASSKVSPRSLVLRSSACNSSGLRPSVSTHTLYCLCHVPIALAQCQLSLKCDKFLIPFQA